MIFDRLAPLIYSQAAHQRRFGLAMLVIVIDLTACCRTFKLHARYASAITVHTVKLRAKLGCATTGSCVGTVAVWSCMLISMG